MKPSTCAASAPFGYDRRGHRDDLDAGDVEAVSIAAIASREMSSESSTGRSLSREGRGRRAPPRPRAPAAPSCPGVPLHALPHVDGFVAFMPSTVRRCAKASDRQQARRHVEVVRRPHRREHLPLRSRICPRTGRQDLGPHDAVRCQPVEAVPFDDLEIEEAPRDREEGDEHEQAERLRAPAHLGKLGVLSGDLHGVTAS